MAAESVFVVSSPLKVFLDVFQTAAGLGFSQKPSPRNHVCLGFYIWKFWCCFPTHTAISVLAVHMKKWYRAGSQKPSSECWSAIKWAHKTWEWSSMVLKIKHLQVHHSQRVWMQEDLKGWKLAPLYSITASAYKYIGNEYLKGKSGINRGTWLPLAWVWKSGFKNIFGLAFFLLFYSLNWFPMYSVLYVLVDLESSSFFVIRIFLQIIKEQVGSGGKRGGHPFMSCT